MGEVRLLTNGDLPALGRLLAPWPVETVQVAAQVRSHGLSERAGGTDILGYWESNRLMSILWRGYSLHPVGASSDGLDAFCDNLGPRRVGSIVGVREAAMGLWHRLCQRAPRHWAHPREVREHQPVLMITTAPNITPDPHVDVVATRHLASYHKASVAMYTEEVGVPPIDSGGSYRDHVASLMTRGLTLGVLVEGSVIFKADVVATAGSVCQIGGVWLAPQLRGHGLSEPLMAGVVARCRAEYDTVSLYANAYNTVALRCYAAVGFHQVNEFSTILY
ncbi:MAG: GNAT family N-acetyltransferase [Propionibacteriaceae bacterium]|jgi:ribosomal protein S18 acetylase RimI-like enzyme|nr:GNAT family N-acetyltransferase [Propionibacteriaceae bacterium]